MDLAIALVLITSSVLLLYAGVRLFMLVSNPEILILSPWSWGVCAMAILSCCAGVGVLAVLWSLW